MKTLQKIIVLLFALGIVLPALAATGNAGAILAGLRKRMSAPSVEALFTINGFDGPVQGSAVMAGDKIAMTTPQMCVWFDGTTQWTYLTASREVNITEPDAAELLASNPFAILSATDTDYTVRQLSDSAGKARVELTPRNTSAGIKTIVICVDRTTGWPSDIKLTFSDGRTISLNVDRINAGPAKPIAEFRYNKAAYPAEEIIDLR